MSECLDNSAFERYYAKEMTAEEKSKILDQAATGAATTKPAGAKALSMCKDCYDSSDPQNYKDNFLYNTQGDRMQRLYPPCKCPAGPAVRTPVTVKPSTSTQKGGWKIHY